MYACGYITTPFWFQIYGLSATFCAVFQIGNSLNTFRKRNSLELPKDHVVTLRAECKLAQLLGKVYQSLRTSAFGDFLKNSWDLAYGLLMAKIYYSDIVRLH